MRAKQLLNFVPFSSKFKLVWDRFTSSRLTTFYLIFSLLHCIIQAALQISAFIINADAAAFLFSIAVQGNNTQNWAVPALGPNDVRLCPDVPINPSDLSTCTVVWNGAVATNYIGSSPTSTQTTATSSSATSSVSSVVSSIISGLSTSPTAGALNLAGDGVAPLAASSAPPLSFTAPAPTSSAASTITIVVIAAPTSTASSDSVDLAGSGNPSSLNTESSGNGYDQSGYSKRATSIKVFDYGNGLVNVTINGHGYDNKQATLSPACLESLNWPVDVLDNTKREDIVFIAFQFWVLGMSIVALLNESIPHIFASLLTHVLATGWSAFQLVNTAIFKKTFARIITNGACQGIPLLPNYWDDRAKLEIPLLALNVFSLLISAVLTWRLVKLFGWQTFKRVGASRSINRIYKLVLVLSIVLQLNFFFTAATVGLWLDSLINGIAAAVAWYVPLYKTSSVITLVLLVPWLWTGWYAVRQEKRVPMFIFLVLSLLYMGGWSVMFLSTTFRWTFLTWRFFTIMAVASIFMTLCSFILGVVCRYNFGKGLPRYLNAQEPLPGDDFTPVSGRSDVEKVDFPSNDKPIPTFSVAFGSGDEVPPPSQMFPSGQRLGPRFYNSSLEPFETSTNVSSDRSDLSVSDVNSRDGARPNSTSGSIASYYTYSPSETSFSRSETGQIQPNGGGKRGFLIE